MDHLNKKDQSSSKLQTLTVNQSSSPSINPYPNSSNPIPIHLFCTVFLATIGILTGTLILILSLTIFKIKDPSLTMNHINITHFDITLPKNNHPISANLSLSLITNISLKNPNIVSFKFSNSTTKFYYMKKMIGLAYAPNGEVRAYRTLQINVIMDFLMDRVVEAASPVNVLREKDVNLTTFTDIKGMLNLLGVYKREVYIVMNCIIMIGFSGNEVEANRNWCEAIVS